MRDPKSADEKNNFAIFLNYFIEKKTNEKNIKQQKKSCPREKRWRARAHARVFCITKKTGEITGTPII